MLVVGLYSLISIFLLLALPARAEHPFPLTSLPSPPYPEPHFCASKGAPPYPVHYLPYYPEHVTPLGTTEVKPAISNSYSCSLIIKKLIPKYPLHDARLKAFATARKDVKKGSSLLATEPRIYFGVKLEVPLIDRREKFREKRELLRASDTATKLLDDYLKTRTEVDFLYHFLTWLWQRVDVGMEYRKDVWQKEIELKKKQAHLKALIAQFRALGISRELLNKCYCETYFITNCLKCEENNLK